MPIWSRRKAVVPPPYRRTSIISGITQDEQDAIWRETRDALRDIYISYNARSGQWTKVAKKMCEILYLMDVTETLLVGHPGRTAEEGSRERFSFLTDQMSKYLEINILVTEMKLEVEMTALGCIWEALHQPGDSRVCGEGTRDGVILGIKLWAQDPNGPSICWLTGIGRTGKSTIARTIAEQMSEDRLLGASFFCSRYSKDRSNLLSIFPTVAYQLARKYSKFRAAMVIRKKYTTFQDLVDDLIVQPLTKSAISTLIIIDALDECKGGESLIPILGQIVSESPGVKFLITSRREQGIRSGFDRIGGSRVHEFDLDRETGTS